MRDVADKKDAYNEGHQYCKVAVKKDLEQITARWSPLSGQQSSFSTQSLYILC